MSRTSRRGRHRAIREGRDLFAHQYRAHRYLRVSGRRGRRVHPQRRRGLHFRLGDRVAVVAYRQEESFSGANWVIVDPLDNSIAETLRYNTAAEAVVPAIEE